MIKYELTYLKHNKSAKNGKTYVELVNKINYSKLLIEAADNCFVPENIKQGDSVNVDLELGGDGFKPKMTLHNIIKK